MLLGILNYSVIGYSNSEELILWMNILSMITGTIGRLASAYFKFYKVTYLSVAQVKELRFWNKSLKSFVWVFLFAMCIRGAEGLHQSTGWIIVFDILHFFLFTVFLDICHRIHCTLLCTGTQTL
jgi:uncharacterized membrane protein